MDRETRKKVEQNSEDIQEIKGSINTIMTNHLFHLEKDMEKQSKIIEKLDARIWWILGILVVSTVIGMVKGGL